MKEKEQASTLPACYNAKKVDPIALVGKLQYMPEEVLFYIFYTMPQDMMQQHAATILFVSHNGATCKTCPSRLRRYQRDWRFHKELKIWITRFSDPTQKTATFERGTYYYFDVTAWKKVSIIHIPLRLLLEVHAVVNQGPDFAI